MATILQLFNFPSKVDFSEPLVSSATLQQIPVVWRQIAQFGLLFFCQVVISTCSVLLLVLRVARDSVDDAGDDAQEGERYAN